MTSPGPARPKGPPPIPRHVARHKRRRNTRTIGAVVAIGVLSLLAYIFFSRPSTESLAKQTKRSVVVIRASTPEGRVSGSGFFVRDSLILTNFHVVDGARALSVELEDGRRFDEVTVVRVDEDHDLAILRVPERGIALRLATDTAISQGAAVFALGNPEGLSYSFSSGVVSSTREVNGIHLLQITAPISHGSSGGPVIDARGRVIGVSTAALTSGQSLNFAVDVRHIRGLIDGRQGDQAQHASNARKTSGLGALMESGIYVLTYEVGRADSLAVFITAASDSFRADVGHTEAWRLPSTQLRGSLEGGLPKRFDYGRSDVQFVLDSVVTRDLFAGHFEIHERGEVTTVRFTVAKRHRSFGGKSLIFVDGGTGSQPEGARSDGGASFTGEIQWVDAGLTTVLGTFQGNSLPGLAAAGGAVPGDTAYGFVATSDSLRFRIGNVTCQVPSDEWPAAQGACWTSKAWFGITLVDANQTGVSREFWRVIPPTFAGIVRVARAGAGDAEVEYLSVAPPQTSGRNVDTAQLMKAWRTSLGETVPAGAPLPWPSSLPRYAPRKGLNGSMVAALRPNRIVVRRGQVWDTVTVSETITSGPDSLRFMLVAALGDSHAMVFAERGDACFSTFRTLTQSQIDSLTPCTMTAALYDVPSHQWTDVAGELTYQHGEDVWTRLGLDERSALVEVSQTRNQPNKPSQSFYVAGETGFQAVAAPLPDSAHVRLHTASLVARGGEVWTIAHYCPRAKAACYDVPGTQRIIVRWKPGSAGIIVARDSTGMLDNFGLTVSDAGRVFLVSKEEIRLADSPQRGVHIPRFAAGLESVLDDSSSNEIVLVSELGEVASVALPAPERRGFSWRSLFRPWRR